MLMAEECTDVTNRAAVRKEGGGHGMAEHVGIHWLAQPGTLGIAVEALPGALGA